VRGDNSSFVTLSTCNELGLQGHLHLASQGLTIGLRTMNMLGSSSQQHIAFELDEEEQGISAPVEDETASIGTDSPLLQLPSNAQYTNKEGLVSDEYRMKQYSSSNAEAQNTQAGVNYANKLYAAANWGSGNKIKHTIKLQQQTPSGWPKHSKPYTSPKDAGSPFRNYCQSHLLSKGATGCTLINGKEGAWSGSIAAQSTEGSMCGSQSATWLKTKADLNGDIFAHEWGHRFGFNHIKDNTCVMNPSRCKKNGPCKFCSASIDAWNKNRGKTGACLV
jgi:hypothetical protein